MSHENVNQRRKFYIDEMYESFLSPLQTSHKIVVLFILTF